MAIDIKRHKSTQVISIRNTSCRADCITDVLPTGAWKGKTCFIIGGGPSLVDFDFRQIRNKLTIGINKSFTKFSTTVNYAMDDRFYDLITFPENGGDSKLHEQWLAYKGIKVFLRHSVRVRYDNSVHFVHSLHSSVLSLDLKQGIWGGNNSGFGAVMLACALGCSHIGLLGYDLKIQKKSKEIVTHWHGGYSLKKNSSFQNKLDKFKKCFDDFAPTIAQQGISVVNLNLDSALTCFPKDSIENFLKE